MIGPTPEEIIASRGVSIDTRTLQPGQLFVAIRGKRFDGNEFVAEAFRRGAAGAVVERVSAGTPADRPLWRVPDTLKELGRLARSHRDRFRPDLVAITGSSGKSTTKTMLAQLLSGDREVLATPGTQNNRVGLPLTLLRLRESHRAVVLELGTNQWGEIRTLTELARPTVGLVTNIGPAHLETFGDLEGVLKEKAALWEALEPSALLILNGDDPLLARAGRGLRRKVVWFGAGPAAEVRATGIRLEPLESSFEVNGAQVRLPVAGRHNVMNALAALACAKVLGVDLGAAAKRLGSFAPLAGRLNLMERDGLLILDDTYNANPASLEAALKVFQAIQRPEGRKVVVLGDMLELGGESEELHARAGRQIVEHGAQGLIAVGPMAGQALSSARKAGLAAGAGWTFKTPEEAGDFLSSYLRPGDLLLLKGSRGIHLERTLACFTTSSIR